MRTLQLATSSGKGKVCDIEYFSSSNRIMVSLDDFAYGLNDVERSTTYFLDPKHYKKLASYKSVAALVRYAKANQIQQAAVTPCPVPASTPAKSSEQGQGILFLEYESTGRGKNTEICEIAVVDQDKNVLFYSLVKPTKRITPDATKAHGITNDDVGLAPTFADIWHSLTRVIGRKTLAFYNAEQTKRVLRQSCAMAFDSETPKHFYTLFPHNKVVCLQRMYAQFYGEYSKVTRDYELWNINYACTQQGIVWRDVPNKRADGTAIKAARLHSHIQAYWGAVA